MFSLIQEVAKDLETELPITRKTQFKKGFKKYRHDKVIMKALADMIDHIKFNKTPPPEYRAHALTARMKGYWDAHLKGTDILMLYKFENGGVTLYGLGSHTDLGL